MHSRVGAASAVLERAAVLVAVQPAAGLHADRAAKLVLLAETRPPSRLMPAAAMHDLVADRQEAPSRSPPSRQVRGIWIDLVNLRSEEYAHHSRIPTMTVGQGPGRGGGGWG